jgi:hypothetical protein
MLITFSGLDGAGKSTLIEWLAATLERQDRRVAVFHMHYDIGVYAILRRVRDRVSARAARGSAARARGPGARRAPPAPTGTRRVRDALVWNKPLRRRIYPQDLLVFLCCRFYVERVARRVLIMDRYFYDTLVDVADGRGWRLLRLFERITPTPTLSIYLDLSPEESFARKGEHSLEYLRQRWLAYRTVLPWVPTSVRIAAGNMDEAKAALGELVTARLAEGDAR